jgi:hypothetical protein
MRVTSPRPVGASPGRAKRADPAAGLGLREPKAKQTQETARWERSPGRAKRADPAAGLGLREPKAKQTQETAGRDHLAESEVVRPGGLEPCGNPFHSTVQRRLIRVQPDRLAALAVALRARIHGSAGQSLSQEQR